MQIIENSQQLTIVIAVSKKLEIASLGGIADQGEQLSLVLL